MKRGTGGNRFIEPEATIETLLDAIRRGLHELRDYDKDRPLDLGAVTIDTERIPNGRISVTVMADLGRTPTQETP